MIAEIVPITSTTTSKNPVSLDLATVDAILVEPRSWATDPLVLLQRHATDMLLRLDDAGFSALMSECVDHLCEDRLVKVTKNPAHAAYINPAHVVAADIKPTRNGWAIDILFRSGRRQAYETCGRAAAEAKSAEILALKAQR